MNNQLPKNLSSFIWHFLKPHKTATVIYVILAVLAGFWGPFNSMLIKYIINTLSTMQGDDLSILIIPAILLVLNFLIFDNITWRVIGYINYKYQPLVKNKIISELFRYILGSSTTFFHENLSGRVASQINILADNISRILYPIMSILLRGISILIIALIATYFVNPIFSLVMTLWFMAFAFCSLTMSKRLISLSDKFAETESSFSGRLVDSISNFSNVRIFSRSAYEVSLLEESLLLTKKTFRTKEAFFLILNCVQGGLIGLMLSAMLYFLIQLYGKHLITVGDFALILGLTMEVAYISWFTVQQVDEFNQAVGKCKQSLNSLIVPQEITDHKNAKDLLVKKGKITFQDVKFHYKGNEPLFQNKTVTINAGQKVGLVGYSGGGKSTFVNLILRLYDVTDGSILIDGQDISKVTQDSLRKNIATIPQDPSLFHRSLMENIRYGNIEATDVEVIAAAKKAFADEFIKKLPEGYESPVGERGVKLSGGQRQRIAIARAILKNAPILILDEATSQLDSVTESEIQESLWQLMQNKTTIIIAHRLSTLLHMDRIIVFDQGKIIEDGTHAELLDQKGLYKTLWDTQVGGFLADDR